MLAALGVYSFDDAAFVDADADGGVVGLAGGDDLFDLLTVVDVAGVEANFGDAGVDGVEGALVMEMDISDEGDGTLADYFGQGVGVGFGGDGQADDFAAFLGQGVDLGETAVDVAGVHVGHALDDDGRTVANYEVAQGDFFGSSAVCKHYFY